jgi:hypothetical protein
MPREKLPDRRNSTTITADWRGRGINVSAGFTSDGRILEIFARAGRPDSDLDCVVDDIAVVLSRALQCGDDLAAIGRGLGRLPSGEPSSIAGTVVDAALQLKDCDAR